MELLSLLFVWALKHKDPKVTTQRLNMVDFWIVDKNLKLKYNHNIINKLLRRLLVWNGRNASVVGQQSPHTLLVEIFSGGNRSLWPNHWLQGTVLVSLAFPLP